MAKLAGVIFLTVLFSGCVSSPGNSQSPKWKIWIPPAKYKGVVASIRSIGGDTITSDKPLRIEHTLTNTTDKPIVLLDVEGGITAFFEVSYMCAGGGIFSIRNVTLNPAKSLTRSIDILRTTGDVDSPLCLSITYDPEIGSGGSSFQLGEERDFVVFRMGYYGSLFVPIEKLDSYCVELVTPPLRLKVGR